MAKKEKKHQHEMPVKEGDKYYCPKCKAEIPMRQDCPTCHVEIDWTRV